MPAIPATLEVDIGRSAVLRQPRQKGSKIPIPISTNKLNVVVYICNPSYSGGRGRRITAKVVLGENKTKKSHKTLSEK
jgi:hypothetical protein